MNQKQKIIKVSAPGKLHLLGEHAVVYGMPSLIAAVDKRCNVTISPQQNNVIKIISNNLDSAEEYTEKAILLKTQNAQETWNAFSKTNNVALLTSITGNPLDFAAICIGETLSFCNQPIPSGFVLSIDSEVQSGMGSSSALAVSIAGAVSVFLGKKLEIDVINEIAFRSEQKQHGFPSGGDNSVSSYGGLIWYRKETPDIKIIQPVPFTLSAEIAKNFYVIHSGKPVESTGEMVSRVRTRFQKRVAYTQNVLHHQELLVRQLATALKESDTESIMEIIKLGERNLEKLGIVSSSVKKIIRAIEKSGGAAKICGAGGIANGSGIILVFHPNKNMLNSIQAIQNQSFANITLGSKGLIVNTNL